MGRISKFDVIKLAFCGAIIGPLIFSVSFFAFTQMTNFVWSNLAYLPVVSSD